MEDLQRSDVRCWWCFGQGSPPHSQPLQVGAGIPGVELQLWLSWMVPCKRGSVSDYETRFAGIARLYGANGLAHIRASHVCVVGIGGVGSWTVEALARSGVGRLTLIDLDEVCVSNMNRQLHAIDGSIGRSKVEVMAGRVRGINPDCQVVAVPEFFTSETAGRLIASKFNFVVDAIDTLRNKCLLIASCREREIPLMVCGGAGGRRDGTMVRMADLAQATHDRLLQKVREILRKEHGFPRGDRKFGVECVFSTEPPVFPNKEGLICASPASDDDQEQPGPVRLNCDWGLGSAAFVTGAFGLAAAGQVVRKLAERSSPG